MNNISDSQLEQAAALVVSSLLASLPSSNTYKHNFSMEFESKISKLISKNKRRYILFSFTRYAVSVFLAAALGLAIWLAADQDARAAVQKWIQTVYENSVIYTFWGEEPEMNLPAYEPEWIPEGFVETSVVTTDSEQIIIYQNKTKNDTVILTYHWVEETVQDELIGTNGDSISVLVNQNQGFYYPSSDSRSANALVWIDDDAGIFLSISSTLSQSDIMHIAESIKLVYVTN